MVLHQSLLCGQQPEPPLSVRKAEHNHCANATSEKVVRKPPLAN